MVARPVPARPPTPRATPAVSPKVNKPAPKPDPISSSRDPASRDGLRSQFNKGPVNDEQTRSAVDTTKGQAVKPDAPKVPAPDAVDVRASASQKLDKAVDSPGRDPASRTDLRSQFAQKPVTDAPGASPAAKVFEEAKGATAGPPMPTGAGPGLGEGIEGASKSMARSLWESSPVKNPAAAIRELGKVAGPAMAYDILDHLGWFDTGGTKPGFEMQDWKSGSSAPTSAPAPQQDAIPQNDAGPMDTKTFGDVKPGSAPAPDAVDVRAGAVAKTADKGKVSKDAGPPPAQASQAGSGVQTKGGFFPIYSHDSPDAQDFEKTYGAAKSSGAQDFKWQGRDYNTK